MIAAGSGVLVLIFLFLPWVGLSGGGGSLSGWKVNNTLDIYLLITAVVAIAAALAGGGGVLPGVTMNGATAVLGIVGTALLLWLVIFDFPSIYDRKIGLILDLLAVAGVAFGGYSAAQEEAASY
jgi:hypothetical protein